MIEVLFGALAVLAAAVVGLWKAYSSQREARLNADREARSAKNEAARQMALREREREANQRQQNIPSEVENEVKSGTRGQFSKPRTP